MSIFLLYLLFALFPSLVMAAHDVSTGAFIIFAIAAIAWIVNWTMFNEESKIKDLIPKTIKAMKISGIVYLISMGVWTVIPSQDQIYTIAGGYVASNIKGINKLPENLVGAANDYLEKLRSSMGKNNGGED